MIRLHGELFRQILPKGNGDGGKGGRVAYALGGEDLCAVGAPRGLPLPDRGAGGGGGGTAADRSDDGELEWDGGAGAERTSPNDGRSWGAGEGAIAMAMLMVNYVATGVLVGKEDPKGNHEG